MLETGSEYMHLCGVKETIQIQSVENQNPDLRKPINPDR
jgi:hypothetical protein